MPVVDTIIGAVDSTGLEITSGDPVLDVTFEGAVISTLGTAVRVRTEGSDFTADINVDGSIIGTDPTDTSFQLGIWYRDNNGTVTVGETGEVRGTEFAIVGFTVNTDPLNLINHGLVFSSETAFSSSNVADMLENTSIIIGDITTKSGGDEVRNSGSITGNVELDGGNDTYNGRGGSVDGEIRGGEGNDTYIVDGTGDTIVELASEGSDEVQSFGTYTLGDNLENLNLRGSANINGTGNDLVNTFNGNSGNNVFKGKAGSDIFEASGGDDAFRGGSGFDTADYSNQNREMVIDLGTGTAIALGKFTDTLSKIERVIGGNRDDTIVGDGGDNNLLGGDGDDELSGRGGIDNIFGQAGADMLFGNGGQDFLDGGASNDTLEGGTGNDNSFGGAGGDVFVFAGSFDNDQIFDFDVNQAGEKIDLSGVSSIRNFNDLRNNHLTDNGVNSTIDDGNGNTILIFGVIESDFTAGDFIF